METVKKNKVVIFHESRGGQFNNGGHIVCKGYDSNFDAEKYGHDIYVQFENINTEIIEQLENKGIDVTDLAFNWDQAHQTMFDNAQIKDEDGNNLISNDLGEVIVNDAFGNYICSLQEYVSDESTFNIDNEYDTYHWRPVSELDEDDWKIVVRDLPFFMIKEMMEDAGVNDQLIRFLEENSCNDDLISAIAENDSMDDLLKYGVVHKFETEEEAEEYLDTTDGVVEINNEYYCKS